MFSFLDDTSLYGDGKEPKPTNPVPSQAESRQVQASTQHLYATQPKALPGQPPRPVEAATPKEQMPIHAEAAPCQCGKELNTLAEVLQARINQAERRTAMMEARLLQVFDEYKNKQTTLQGGCSWTIILIAVICLIALWIWSSRSDNSRAMDSASYPVMIPGGAPPSPMIVPIATAAGNIPTTFLRQ